jgi:hypothetical protein
MKSSSTRLRALTVALPMILLGLAPSASAFFRKPPPTPPAPPAPTGDYALFSDCPLSAPNITDCLVTQASGGQFTVGKTTVPIDRTITIQGGLATNPETEGLSFVPPADGQTLSQTPLEFPGGLLGLLSQRDLSPWAPHNGFNRWYQRFNTLTATLELVGPLQVNIISILTEEGPALVLPLSVKLDNPLLGNRCYIGSPSEPITVNLTDGTTSPPPPNQPISGTPGSLSLEDEADKLTLSGSSFVDNSFAVPRAHGCGPFGLLDRAIDHQLELPSAAGNNTAIIDGTESLATAEAVLASE